MFRTELIKYAPIKSSFEISMTDWVCRRGFAAQASTKALETVQTLGAQYNPYVEVDQVENAYDQNGNPI